MSVTLTALAAALVWAIRAMVYTDWFPQQGPHEELGSTM